MSSTEAQTQFPYADGRPVPPLRSDIDIVPFSDGGDMLVALHDRRGYAAEPMVLYASVFPIAELANGVLTAGDIAEHLGGSEQGITTEQIAGFFTSIDEAGYLESDRFRDARTRRDDDFLQSSVREPACAGTSYASDTKELQKFLDKVMESAKDVAVEGNATAVVAPHIDLRVGAECYAPAYRALQNTDADLFVVIGTSHYGWQDLFILTEKNFRTPLGIVNTDVEMVRALSAALPFELHPGEIAHRDEHSIEFQLLFLQHLFGDRPFTVLPVLVTSFQPFIDHDMLPSEADRFDGFITALRSVVEASGRKAVFIASADMAHVGRKFGDDFAAETLLPALASEDAYILDRAASVDTSGFFTGIASVGDRRRICGLPPIYSMLEAVQPSRGTLLDYRQWSERETESAVTFASMAFYR